MLPCGHNEGHMWRARHRGQLYKYCMMCLFEKVDMWQVGKEPVVHENYTSGKDVSAEKVLDDGENIKNDKRRTTKSSK